MRNKQVDILVIGGGISGITAALEAAEAGYRVILAEKQPFLGGKVAAMHRYFPKLCPPYCGLEINFQRIRNNPRIEILTSTIVTHISGQEGGFRVTLVSRPPYVNQYCTACGECSEVCPVDRPNDFNHSLDRTKAIYLPHKLAYPLRYTIDEQLCLKDECRKCAGVCRYGAIDFTAAPRITETEAGAVVIATGWNLYDPSHISGFLFGECPDVITSLMLERMASPGGPSRGEVLRPSNGERPEKIAFVQCAGSRDENHLPYCSGVCCSASLKQAVYLTELYTEATISIFYIDLRVTGRNEDFLKRVAEHPRIRLIKGKVGRISPSGSNGRLLLETENILAGKKETPGFDLVVLAPGIRPELAKLEQIQCTEAGFIADDRLPPGIYAAGCCKKPMDVSMSLKDATGIALKAIQSARSKSSWIGLDGNGQGSTV